jgi:hypothetical protein
MHFDKCNSYCTIFNIKNPALVALERGVQNGAESVLFALMIYEGLTLLPFTGIRQVKLRLWPAVSMIIQIY